MAKLLTILIVIMGILGTIGFYRLPPGWVVPSFQKALNESLGAVELTVPEVKISWGGWRNPLGIHVRQVTIKSTEKGATLVIPRLLFSLKMLPLFIGKAEIAKCSFDMAKLYVKDLMIGEIAAKIKMRGKKASLKLDFKNFNSTAFIHFISNQKDLPSASLPIQGTLLLEGSHSVGITSVNLACHSQGGSLIIPEIYPEAVRLDSAHLLLTGTGQTISLKKLKLTKGNAHLSIHGSLHSPVHWKKLYEAGGKLDLILQGKGGDIAVDDLKYLWPHGLSPKPRKWVVNQLSKGTADHVSAHMQGSIHMIPNLTVGACEIPQIEGEIDASGITVDYFGKLPPVMNTKGKCRFTREEFIIDATGVAHDILLTSAKIIIHDIHVKDQTINIDLNLEGPVRNSLEIINSDPLYLARKLDIEPKRITGRAVTTVHLSFPLETDVPLELVMVKAHSTIKDGKIAFEANSDGKPIKLEKGEFDLDVSRQSLNMKGVGYLQNILTQIQWHEYFEDKATPFRRQFILNGLLDLKKLKNFGFNVDDYLVGQAPTNIKYLVDPASNSYIEGFVDLTPVIMVSPILPWQKPQGEPGHFKIMLRKESYQEGFKLDEATLIAPKLSMTMGENDSGHGTVFQIKHLQIGNSRLNSTIHKDKSGLFQATIKGSVLDLSHILDDTAPEPLIKPSLKNEDSDTQIQVNLYLEQVQLGKDNIIHNVNGDMLYKGSTLKWANLKGKPPHNDGGISLNLIPLSKDRQQFTLESDDGGHLLEMLGADYELEGGHLVIQGVKTDTYHKKLQEADENTEKNWEIVGDITIDDFTINRAPLLARLLSAASLQGIVNFFSGRGIHFHSGEAKFSLTPAILQLNKVRLISPSIGLLLNGSIDRLKHKVDFSGELIPLYIVNAVLARIPLLGSWISGGKEDGVFMTQFTLKGYRKDPTLEINPITTVTPGLVREMFTPQEVKH